MQSKLLHSFARKKVLHTLYFWLTGKDLNPDDRLAMDKIVTLIQSDRLHRTDYISQRKAALNRMFWYYLFLTLERY